MRRYTGWVAGRLVFALALLLLACVAAPRLAAQDAQPAAGSQPYLFADTPFGIGPRAVREHLEAKGYVYDSTYATGDLAFHGRLLNTQAVIWALLANGTLQKISVRLVTADEDARSTYRTVKANLIEKYGPPGTCAEGFRSPYFDGDGYEEQAFRLGKAYATCLWGDIDNNTVPHMGVKITKVLTVDVSYESETWPAEAHRRQRVSDF